jgi:hypothetical protein
MELIIQNNEKVSLGDTVYYVNTGDAKSTGDLKTITDKETGTKTIELNCKLISREQMEKNPDMTTDEYNAARYIHAFNKRIKPLLVCFSREIREREELITRGKYKGDTKTVENILIEVIKVKDPETKKTRLELQDRNEFTEKQCELVAGEPFEEGDQDSYEALMTMEDKEIRFWTSVNKLPNFMEQDEWDEIVLDYNRRMDEARRNGIQEEKDRLDALFQTLEIKDLNDISIYGLLPRMVEIIVTLHQEDGVNYLRSRKWDDNLCLFDDMWKYEAIANERQQYYNTVGNGGDDDRYEQWLDHKASEEFLHGDSGSTQTVITIQETDMEDESADYEELKKSDAEVKADMVDAMNAIETYNKNKKAVEEDEELQLVDKVSEWMAKDGYIVYLGNSFIKQEWMDNNQPYDRMAIPYVAALKMYNNRDAKTEMKEAVAEHKREVKENKEDDEFNF